MDAKVIQYRLKVSFNQRLWNSFKVESLAPRKDGSGNLSRFGGGQDKLGVGRRFLQGLQQGVEGTGGQHVNLVYDIHLIAAHRRGKVDLIPKIPYLIHPIVAGGVDLQNIGGKSLVPHGANGTGPAGLPVHRVKAIHGPGQYFGGAGFAGASRAAEQIGVGGLSRLYLAFQHPGDMLLAHHVGKPPGPVFSV